MKAENIKIDPITPDGFYSMNIDDMPKDVIEEWFGIPYVQSRGENSEYSVVLCLDGGAWDRPTNKGIFNSLDEAINFILENYEDIK